MNDWNIKPRSAQCAECGLPFTPGVSGHSILETGEAGLTRRDLCKACFASLEPEAVRAFSGVWAFTIPQATIAKQKEEPLRKETAEHLLRRLLERNAQEDRSAIYVLAVLLERGKNLVERKVVRSPEGRKLRLYEQRGTGDLFTIEDPELRPEDLPGVQQRVLDLLEGRDSPQSVRRVRRSWRRDWARRRARGVRRSWRFGR